MTPDDPGPFTAMGGAAEGAFLQPPVPTEPGEVIPPIPCSFAVGLTDPDVKGHRWAILRGTDGTVTVDFRVPWQMAAQIGAGIGQGLAQMQSQAEQEASGGLILPGGSAAGSLLIPQHGVPRPQMGNGGRG